MPLKASQINYLKRLLFRRPIYDGGGAAERFILNYIIFEAVLNYIISEYRLEINFGKDKKNKDKYVRKDTAIRALAHFEILMPCGNIDLLLDSKAKRRGEKSARNLRNGIVHEWHSEDIEEVKSRSSELEKLFTVFLSAVAHLIDHSESKPLNS